MAPSLPITLLERLQKRGIIRPTKNGSNEYEEEVFAENYDQDEAEHERNASEKEGRYRGGAPGCPNKNNQYHICTDFCFDHWGEGYPEHRLSEKYLDERKKMLKDFPLPPGWKEVYDPGMRRHYYWNSNTDEVCWISPKHPKAIISEAAAKIARGMRESGIIPGSVVSQPIDKDNRRSGRGERGDYRDNRERDRRRGDRERVGRDRERELDRRRRRESGEEDSDGGGKEKEMAVELTDRDRLRRAKKRGIDPMDPSAYADVSEGSWASGLYEETKTGADVTASGPLFQMRPYPAPGAILRKKNPGKE